MTTISECRQHAKASNTYKYLLFDSLCRRPKEQIGKEILDIIVACHNDCVVLFHTEMFHLLYCCAYRFKYRGIYSRKEIQEYFIKAQSNIQWLNECPPLTSKCDYLYAIKYLKTKMCGYDKYLLDEGIKLIPLDKAWKYGCTEDTDIKAFAGLCPINIVYQYKLYTK